jgi:hypothetical protein
VTVKGFKKCCSSKAKNRKDDILWDDEEEVQKVGSESDEVRNGNSEGGEVGNNDSKGDEVINCEDSETNW